MNLFVLTKIFCKFASYSKTNNKMDTVSINRNLELLKIQRDILTQLKDEVTKHIVNDDNFDAYVSITEEFVCVNVHLKSQNILYAFDIVFFDTSTKITLKKSYSYDLNDTAYITLLNKYISVLELLKENGNHYITVMAASKKLFKKCETQKYK